ncbi:hypothetical protein, partial [Paenibacillus sp. VTT E-133291]|uniref:hypothetical protein n=1 Tax=Paenibacillus sp. VTT E-133291 TaxID=1986223 RepID=UPI000BD4B512
SLYIYRCNLGALYPAGHHYKSLYILIVFNDEGRIMMGNLLEVLAEVLSMTAILVLFILLVIISKTFSI